MDRSGHGKYSNQRVLHFLYYLESLSVIPLAWQVGGQSFLLKTVVKMRKIGKPKPKSIILDILGGGYISVFFFNIFSRAYDFFESLILGGKVGKHQKTI